MPWKGVTVSEQRQRFLEDYQLNYYPIVELAERYSIARKTAHKWIERFEEEGQSGYHEHSRRPQSCPWQTDAAIVEELVEPGEPQQNGVHERMHRTLKQEATVPPAGSLRSQQQRFDRFREEFNEVRPHEALGMKRPAQVYHPSTRSMPKRMQPYDYPSHYLVRRVSRCGTIRVLSKQVFVSQTLNEDYVGLEEVDDGVYDLFFCFYHIGRYELRANKIHDIVSRVAVSRRQVDLASRVSPMSLE